VVQNKEGTTFEVFKGTPKGLCGKPLKDPRHPAGRRLGNCTEREFFIDNLLVRNHFIIVMIRCTGLAP